VGGDVDGEIWRILFAPSAPVRKRVDAAAAELQLAPGNYVSVHVRALHPTLLMAPENYAANPLLGENVHLINAYETDGRDLTFHKFFIKKFIKGEENDSVTTMALNAIKCGTLLLSNAPLYFTSDSAALVRRITKQSTYSENVGVHLEESLPEDFRGAPVVHPVHLVARTLKYKHRNQHLDCNKSVCGPHRKEFFAAFVDLLIMAGGRCVTYGVGDYGLLAARLTGNARTCSFRHQTPTGEMNGLCHVDPR